MDTRKFLWHAHPARALLEAWLIGLPILFLLSRQVGYVPPVVLGNGLLFLCGTCGMWVVLRTRVPQGNWLRQGIWEMAVALALSLMMFLGFQLLGQLLGWQAVWVESALGSGISSFLLLATGPGYLIARLGVRLWLLWDRLRQQRMVWALTHAQLTVVAVVILIGTASMLFLTTLFLYAEPAQERTGFFTAFTERLLHTLFPAVTMFAIMTVLTLLALLPPSALVSYLVALKTTRRLETLVEAARALRQGRYSTRVAVVGQDEVAQLQADFNAMAGDLERTMHDLEAQRDAVSHLLQSRRELVASVSHELRTPVATMRATLESALARQSSGPQGQDPARSPVPRHDLEVLEGEVLRLQGLIDDLFSLSQTEVAGLALDCQPTDVAPVVQHMVDALAPLAWDSGRVEVIADLPPTLPPAQVDAGRLEQVLANLLHNGIRHTPPGGIVAAVVREEPEAVAIEVRDTGGGITPDDLPYIWQRFYRGRGSSGTGLGLALVKELTEAMGGSVAVESEVGQGSCFSIRLPQAAPSA